MTLESPDRATSPQRQKCVLIVDDEPIIADTLAAILRNTGYRPVPIYDPLKALLRCQHTCPDFVISDVVMPEMTGIELAIQIERHCAKAKILLFSGMALSHDLLQEARQQGHNFELLTKPIHPRDLLAKLKECLQPAAD